MRWRLKFGISILCLSGAAAAQIKDTPNASTFRPEGRLDNGFVFCSMHFQRDRVEESGSGWNTDYPRAGRYFMLRLSELLKLRIVTRGEGEPVQWVTSVERDDLFLCPFVLVSDAGTMRLTEEHAERLREYLLKGGFIWFDDSWGTLAWQQILRELGKVVPKTWRVMTPSFEHSLYRIHFHIDRTLQVSHMSFWTSAGRVDERGEDSPLTPLRVVLDERSRVAAVITHNTDIGDTWERESVRRYFEEFSSDGYALASNVLLHAMTN